MNMDRAIFDLNASVEATSLYILLCALMDLGEPPTLALAETKWNAPKESLLAAADELIGRGVVNAIPPIRPETHLHMNPRNEWR